MVNRTQEEIMQNWGVDNSDTPLVSIKCMTFNHEKYISQTLDGFLMQETNFPFEILVHDDASTDKTADVLREYETKYPKIIKPIYEIENQYSKGNKAHHKKIDSMIKGKYIAFCEGDDYWIKSSKLQKQVDWMRTHPDYTMCCCDADIVSSSHFDFTRYSRDCDIPSEDMILGGGLWVQTCSTLYRRDVYQKYGSLEFCNRCHVGDYCMQILSALMGKVRYMKDRMAAYRYLSPNSWTVKNIQDDYKKKISGWQSEVEMLLCFDEFSNGLYHKTFYKRISSYLYGLAVYKKGGYRSPKEIKDILHVFSDVKKFSFAQKLKIYLMTHGMMFIFVIKRKIQGLI